MKKKICGLILICLTSTLAIKECYASAGIDTKMFSSSSVGPPNDTIEWEKDGETLSCYYEYSITGSHTTRVYGYNQEDESIINGVVTPNESIPAGTSIGIKISETKTISWEVTKTLLVKTKTTSTTTASNCTKCTNWQDPCKPNYVFSIGKFKIPFLLINKCIPVCTKKASCNYGETGCTCTGETTTTETEKIDPTDEEIEECEQKAEEKVKEMAESRKGASYKVTLMDSNDIEATGPVATISGSGGCSGENPIYCQYEYKITRVCINIKSSEVRYTSGACNSDEMEVKNGDNGHWHYFVPLNAKSNNDFVISMAYSQESGKQTKDFCQNVINENPSNYLDFIRDKDYNKLTGNKTQDLQIVENGCYLGTEIRIPISQEFYNETSEYKFKGFNFYYKPIDINDPFPNGVGTNSLWTDWYDDYETGSSVTPDISKSYDEVTYIAQYIDANKVREYNKDNQYTNWDSISLNGVSSFISNEGIVTRNNGVINSFYKLGCGPYNADWSECR